MVRPVFRFLALTVLAWPLAVSAAEGERWAEIRAMLFEDRSLVDGSAVLELQAPSRALDASTVPIAIAARDGAPAIRTLWLVIDENPAPVAATFHLDPKLLRPRIETRVRVNAYTNVHAVAEAEDGTLYVVERFVKAAGGCSAPGLKDKEIAMARLGKMKLKPLDPFRLGEPMRVKLMIAHPNYTGLQIDQLTRQWIPPDYVTHVEVRYDGRTALRVDSDISISEDPTFIFSVVPDRAATLTVLVDDSSERHFEKSWSLGPNS